jgi:hypothetical protein
VQWKYSTIQGLWQAGAELKELHFDF